MTLSPQMKLKMEKIDSLIDKGYVLKTQFGTLIPNLISPQGKSINTYSRRYGDDPLAGFSWIAFFFPFALATQIRHWSYFWFVGIIAFLFDIFVAIPFNIDINTGLGIGIGMFYGYTFPYQRWLFLKSKEKELGVFNSILIGLLATALAMIPTRILWDLYT